MNLAKRLMVGSVAFAVVAGLAACSSTTNGGTTSPKSTMDKIRTSGVIRYGVIVGEAPGFIQGANNQWTGYCAVTAQAIAKALNLKAVAVETTWGNMALDLQSNKIDMAVCAQPTGARALVADYTTHPMYTNYFGLIVTTNKFDHATWAQLNSPSVRIGAQQGDSTLQPIQFFAPRASISLFDSRDKNLLALQAGHVDASANTLLNSLMAAKARTDMKAHVVVPEPLVAAPSAVMVAQSSDHAFLDAVDAVVWGLNSSGSVRAWIMQALSTYGITQADLPPNAVL